MRRVEWEGIQCILSDATHYTKPVSDVPHDVSIVYTNIRFKFGLDRDPAYPSVGIIWYDQNGHVRLVTIGL